MYEESPDKTEKKKEKKKTLYCIYLLKEASLKKFYKKSIPSGTKVSFFVIRKTQTDLSQKRGSRSPLPSTSVTHKYDVRFVCNAAYPYTRDYVHRNTDSQHN